MTFPRSIFVIPCLPARAGEARNLCLARNFDFSVARARTA
jgi:hypothetical protein